MKIKTDFTTNSSSSSFVCWGVSEDDIEGGSDAIKLKAFATYFSECTKKVTEYPADSYYKEAIADMAELVSDEEKIEYADDNGLTDDAPLPLSKGGPYETKYIGLSPYTMEKYFPEVTFGNLREFVASKMNEVLGTTLSASDIDYYEEGWMDN
jgi:hypothetical protein